MKHNILQINSSARFHESITRQVSDLVISYLQQNTDSTATTHRDVTIGLPFINEEWVKANFTAQEERDEEQRKALNFSNKLVTELQQASYIVISVPIYNFSIPATLKAWIDLVVRANLTFSYNEEGQPIGLLTNKKAIVIIASGGTPLNSDWDKATPYLKQILGFIGLTNLTFIDATKITLDENDISKQLENLINRS